MRTVVSNATHPRLTPAGNRMTQCCQVVSHDASGGVRNSAREDGRVQKCGGRVVLVRADEIL